MDIILSIKSVNSVIRVSNDRMFVAHDLPQATNDDQFKFVTFNFKPHTVSLMRSAGFQVQSKIVFGELDEISQKWFWLFAY